MRHYLLPIDNLPQGPCHADPYRQAELRSAYWQTVNEVLYPPRRSRRRSYEPEQWPCVFNTAPEFIEKLQRFPANQSVVLWTSTAWQDCLRLWCLLDAVRRFSLDRERFWLAQPSFPDSDETRQRWLGCYPDTALREAYEHAIPVRPNFMRSGSVLWRLYASLSPRGFEKARQAASSHFPDWRTSAIPYGWFFPRVVGPRSRQLRLAELDQALLDALRPNRWVRPVDLLLKRRSFFWSLMEVTGDLIIAYRLHVWASHCREDPLVLGRSGPEGGRSMSEASYRLTARGQRVRDEGLADCSEAPAMFVGGCPVYAGRNPWVRRIEGETWRIEQLFAD